MGTQVFSWLVQRRRSIVDVFQKKTAGGMLAFLARTGGLVGCGVPELFSVPHPPDNITIAATIDSRKQHRSARARRGDYTIPSFSIFQSAGLSAVGTSSEDLLGLSACW